MAIRMDPISKDIALIIRDDLSPDGRRKAFAAFAQAEIDKADAQNDEASGYDVPYKTFVDGRPSSNLEGVKPDGGMIAAEWEMVNDIFGWIHDQLMQQAPVLSGQYKASFAFYADDAPADVRNPPQAQTYHFLNTQPYARKIERGLSSKAPDGVFQVVATLASRKFGNLARVRFTYRGAGKGERQPAILILPR